jgi:hypothetical protein
VTLRCHDRVSIVHLARPSSEVVYPYASSRPSCATSAPAKAKRMSKEDGTGAALRVLEGLA